MRLSTVLPTVVVALLVLPAVAMADLALQPPVAGSGKIVTLPSGLRYLDLRVGTGAEVAQKASVTVHYVGRLADGTEIDASRPRGVPMTFRIGVGQLIKGWELGVPGMRVGGLRRLYIPPSLAYGNNGRPQTIPPNTELIFEVEVLGTAPLP